MNNEGWVRIFDRLPKIDEEVEVEDYQGKIYKAKLLAEGSEYRGEASAYRWNIDIEGANLWRPVSEKKPDFSKLKTGNMIIIDDSICGYVNKLSENNNWIYVSQFLGMSHSISLLRSGIKKITRINIENQTFEEI